MKRMLMVAAAVLALGTSVAQAQYYGRPYGGYWGYGGGRGAGYFPYRSHVPYGVPHNYGGGGGFYGTPGRGSFGPAYPQRFGNYTNGYTSMGPYRGGLGAFRTGRPQYYPAWPH